jgi:DNA-binding LytR/AlgR family response regulator
MYGYWRQEQLSRIRDEEEVLIIRSDKRNFRVRPSQVLYIEGLGNYVTFYLKGK